MVPGVTVVGVVTVVEVPPGVVTVVPGGTVVGVVTVVVVGVPLEVPLGATAPTVPVLVLGIIGTFVPVPVPVALPVGVPVELSTTV